ncbi:hypothetical protein UFOVP779_43 [uncultured Caudovirales phage]|uniref:Uncharacterized protein n=1 Tax=uncultured Caudovirales phage TaxID=2100421 RepID=A0A6J5NUG3_9CAUD|nr:hypothetical protein UFOVP779_43 [uncultured Caudovirales phage]
MSAAPASGLESVTSDEAVRQGIIASILGMAAMIARLLMSTDKASLGYIARSSVAAGLTAYFVNQASKSYVEQENLRVFICGVAGFASPEILSYGLAWLKAKMQGKVQEAQAQVKGGKPRKAKRGSKGGK